MQQHKNKTTIHIQKTEIHKHIIRHMTTEDYSKSCHIFITDYTCTSPCYKVTQITQFFPLYWSFIL